MLPSSSTITPRLLAAPGCLSLESFWLRLFFLPMWSGLSSCLGLAEAVGGWLRGWGGVGCIGGFFFECWAGRMCCLYSGVLEVLQSLISELFAVEGGVHYLERLVPGLRFRVEVV